MEISIQFCELETPRGGNAHPISGHRKVNERVNGSF